MEPDLSQCLVAYAGEVITCPECGAELAVFATDIMGNTPHPWPVDDLAAALREFSPEGSFLGCRCGGDPATGGGRAGLWLRDAIGPQLNIGGHWRAIGGE